MIVLLLNCFTSSLMADNDTIPLRASNHNDTINAIIPIYTIKGANAKLIERLYLIDINNEKDSIIELNKLYINEQYNIIKDFQNKIVDHNNINNNLKKDIERQKLKTNIFIGTTSALIITTIIGFLIK